MSDHDLHGAPETSHSNMILSIIGALGTLLLFALLIYIAYYVPAQRMDAATGNIAAQRKETLAQTQAQAANTASTYKVVDAEKGVVRIPIERAMELVVPRLNEGKSQE